jgi:N-acetylmuramoyl-L-alanine amidase
MNIGPRFYQRTPFKRKTLVFALACLMLAPVSTLARTVAQKKQAAKAQFEAAERLRDALESKPESQRTRRDFQKVIEAYRKVYYTAPSWVKADAAVLAVAELLDDQGRILNDPKSFKDAIGQLVFLRREYPGSKYRAEALFTIAEIYRDDLDDGKQAKATFEDFLKHYPGNSHAQEARRAIAEIDNPSAARSPFKAKAPKRERPVRTRTLRAAEDAPKDPAKDAPKAPADDDPAVAAPAQQQDVAAVTTDSQTHRLPRLTGIRHWSTGDYTRVAIDLEQEVKYQAGRVPRPDRIFFDLYGTKLAPELVGKTFEVDAGFLHKIRVAQYKINMARVVLDVDDVAEYSAFLLPNPYRLIIDIHGKLPPTKVAVNKEPKPVALEPKPAAVETKQPPQDTGVAQDVTVTTIKQPESKSSAPKPAGNVAAAIQSAEATKSAPLRGQGKDKDKDQERVVTETPAQIAKVVTPKVVVDDTGLDNANSDRAAGQPTSGPTFESIAPKESSRNKKKTVDVATRTTTTPATTTHTAAPNAAGERSLIRALGLKIGKIVVDAGHGGHDTGTIGPNGLEEKDLVLDVALKLGKLLEDKLGAEVVYTRDDDTFIPLETRTAIANKEQADLFISIHANSSDDPTARGVETYYLNFTSRADALEVAARENAVSEKSIHELQDLVKKIALKEKIGESREFAADVQRSLYNGLSVKNPSLRNRGVKKAPFVVLIGANMPSILAEISFVSNPEDAKKLKTNDYRQRIADSLYKGVSRYVNSLSGVKVASKNTGANSGVDRTTSVAAAK